VQAVAAGAMHSLILKTDGSLWAMGLNSSGQLGDGTTTQRNSPVQVFAGGVQAVAAGGLHSLILKTDGSLWVMGDNSRGQLGDGTTTQSIAPELIAVNVQKIAAGQYHSLIVASGDVRITSAAPTIATQPQSQIVNASGTMTMTVAATGVGPFTYQWYKNSIAIASATSATLTLTSVTAANAGSYTCVVTNSAGSTTSSAATLTVSICHSADTNQDGRLSLVELTRVIELYNTRNGATRTGRYKVQAGTEDGFAQDTTATANQTLTQYHSADSNRDGQIGLSELTRVIDLYNTRAGTSRTGQYHVQAGTEDGFAPGSNP